MRDEPPENPGFSIEPLDDYSLAVAAAWNIFHETGDQRPLVELGVLSQEWPLIEPEENDQRSAPDGCDFRRRRLRQAQSSCTRAL